MIDFLTKAVRSMIEDAVRQRKRDKFLQDLEAKNKLYRTLVRLSLGSYVMYKIQELEAIKAEWYAKHN